MEKNFHSLSAAKSHTLLSSFCSLENLPQRVALLDQELSVYGYPSIQSNNHLDEVTIVNVTYDLLLSYRKILEAHSDTADELHNSESNAARSQHLLSLAREDVAGKDRELKSKCIEEAHLQQRIETLRRKHKSEQEKTRKMSADLLSRDTQFKHEKKKKMQEIEKLQNKLHQLLQDKRHERMLGIELLNSLQRTDGKRGKWNTDKSKKNTEQEMYRLIITNYEDSQRQLLSENADMRKYLKQMQDELIAALNERTIQTGQRPNSKATLRDGSRRDSLESETSVTSDESELSTPMSEGVFEMPYDLVKEDIEKSLKSKWKALRKMHKQRSKSEDISKKLNSTVTDSTERFQEYERVVKEQQELIDYLTTCQDAGQGGVLTDTYFLEEKAELDKSRALFKQQRVALEKERKVYTEALLQLGQDRQKFEEEKGTWFQKNFLQLTPFRDNSSKTKKSTPESRKSSRRKGLSSSWNESLKAYTSSASPVRSARGEADGMGTSALSPGSSPPLALKSPNLKHFTPSPENFNPWNGTSPPIPSTCELYRALGLRYNGKENQDDSSVACTPIHADARAHELHHSMSRSETNLHLMTSDHASASNGVLNESPSIEEFPLDRPGKESFKSGEFPTQSARWPHTLSHSQSEVSLESYYRRPTGRMLPRIPTESQSDSFYSLSDSD